MAEICDNAAPISNDNGNLFQSGRFCFLRITDEVQNIMLDVIVLDESDYFKCLSAGKAFRRINA